MPTTQGLRTTSADGTPIFTVNRSLLINGGILAVVGAAVWATGGAMVAAAGLSVLRQWMQSEHRQELMDKAKTASMAATTAWKQHPSRTIRLPDTDPARAASAPLGAKA